MRTFYLPIERRQFLVLGVNEKLVDIFQKPTFYSTGLFITKMSAAQGHPVSISQRPSSVGRVQSARQRCVSCKLF